MEDTSEPRFNADFIIRVFGMDADSRPFSQTAHAQNISDSGAKLSGLEKQLRPGDVIGVQFGDKKARCKVMWAVDAGNSHKIEVGVKTLEGQLCPWQNEREIQRANTAAPISRIKPAPKDKRKFARQRIRFSIEIRSAQSVGSHMQTDTADIAGGGCYVETMMPLPVGTVLNITFWLNSARVQTTAIVRTCHGGVGMGIEFTGLDDATRAELQQQIENLVGEAVPFRKARAAF